MSVTEPAAPQRSVTGARLAAVLVVFGAFLGGVVAGVVGDRIYNFRRGFEGQRSALHFITPRIVAHLDHDLDLTDSQRAKVEEIVERHRQRIEAVWSGVRPQVWREIELTNAEIEPLLTAEQRVKFARLKMQIRFHHGPPGGRPPDR